MEYDVAWRGWDDCMTANDRSVRDLIAQEAADWFVANRASPTAEERHSLAALQHWQTEETGYQWIQETKPQTLAYGLTDSPVDLAA